MQLIMGRDAEIAAWMFDKSKCNPMGFNLAVGIGDDSGQIVGGLMFTGYNGSDAEVHYYGPGFLKRRTVKALFTIAVQALNLNRLTIRTRKDSMARGVQKLGAVPEGTIRRLYGPTDEDRHAGRQFVFFRERMEELAGLKG